jgi:hypothetical protein
LPLVGPDVDSPVIAVPGPDGERVAGFAELKRTRLSEPDFS